MAPTLKHTEVDAADSVAAVPHGVIVADEQQPNLTTIVSSSDNSNEALANNNNKSAFAAVPLAATATSTATATAAGQTIMDPPPSPPPAAAAAAAAAAIETEADPSKIPDDESAFLVPPHFHRTNPFHRNLSNLDLSMRCSICKDFYRAPVTLLPCFHNFCSLCVRKHLKESYTGMKRKADCPQCHKPVRMPGSTDYNKGILPNKFLEQQVDIYQQCRDPLRVKLVRLDLLEKEKELGILTRATSQGNNNEGWGDFSLDGGVGGGRGKKRGNKSKEEELSSREVTTRSSKRARRTVSKKANYSSSASSDSDESDDDNGTDDKDYCDDAGNNSKMASLDPPNNHEAVVSRTQQQQRPQQQQLKRKPTVSYHSLKKKKLVELCQKEGLIDRGSEEELKQRHSEFITLYNAECDSEHPRSVNELVKEMKSREMSIKMEASNTISRKASKFMKNLGNSVEAYNKGGIGKPTSGSEEFDATLNNSFATMIADIKKRKQQPIPVAGKGENNNIAMKSNGGATQESAGGIDQSHGVASLSNHKKAGESHPAMSSSSSEEPDPGVSEFGRINGDDAVSSSASIDSETPQKLLPKNNFKAKSSLPSKSKTAGAPPAATMSNIATTKRASPKKSSKSLKKSTSSTRSNSQSRITRVSSLGPWSCETCTYVNKRNTTKKARCEMCNAVRPEESGLDRHAKDVEVVNIDC